MPSGHFLYPKRICDFERPDRTPTPVLAMTEGSLEQYSGIGMLRLGEELACVTLLD
ncbi:MAG: hypothetical protein ACI9W6_002935, partial [Motiliproteus sp.]